MLNLFSEAFEHAMAMNALQSSLDDLGQWSWLTLPGVSSSVLVLHVLLEGITATRKHPGGDPRMRFGGFLANFLSTLFNGSGGVMLKHGA